MKSVPNIFSISSILGPSLAIVFFLSLVIIPGDLGKLLSFKLESSKVLKKERDFFSRLPAETSNESGKVEGVAFQEKGLQPIDPSREWLGNEYADYLWSYLRFRYPKSRPTLDSKEIGINKKENSLNASQILGNLVSSVLTGFFQTGNFKQNFMKSMIESFSPDLRSFVITLKNGEYIRLRQDQIDFNQKAQEAKLERWVLSQPESSLLPHQILGKSFELTNGKLVCAWVLVWNMASKNWEASSVRNYSGWSTRLFSLTGERHLWQGGVHFRIRKNGERDVVEKIVTKRGDEFSYFYHRVGVELLTLVISDLTGNDRLAQWIGRLGAIGEWFTYRKTAGVGIEALKRVNNDLLAAESGRRIFEWFSFDTHKSNIRNPLNYLNKNQMSDFGYYLRSNLKKFGNFYQKSSYGKHNTAGTKIVYEAEAMNLEELKLRFSEALMKDALGLDILILISTVEGERLHRGLVKYQNSEIIDGDLDILLKAYIEPHQEVIPFSLDPSEGDWDFDVNSKYNLWFIEKLNKEFNWTETKGRLNYLIERTLVKKKNQSLINARGGQCSKVFSYK